ncbi:MAG: DnaD domain protein [Chloroflexi bacterium]|jgi:DnaD/phage-associated family protein|nr:DnaD domain protein [Chloroflexota bacterium]MBT4514025.1 DnaD domain protein [Chloroflexota bacterium]MBT5320687.1 DnaD domain protein [Chloroflexota bacterium]MBT6682572.1 DnaD domain protein [Chloroflexota bacterium]
MADRPGPSSGDGTRRDSQPFPVGYKSTPVPNPLLSSLLEEIDDLDELKVTLRAIWFLHQRRLFPSSIQASDLYSDRTTSAMLRSSGAELEGRVSTALENAVRRGTLLAVRGDDAETLYLLNSDTVRRALETSHPGWERVAPAETYPGQADAGLRSSVFTDYEHNIGTLTPAISDTLRDALETYPEQWIREAITIAARANARNWNYMAAVLRGWAEEGRPDGKPGSNTDSTRSDEYIQRYLDAQRARGNR